MITIECDVCGRRLGATEIANQWHGVVHVEQKHICWITQPWHAHIVIDSKEIQICPDCVKRSIAKDK